GRASGKPVHRVGRPGRARRGDQALSGSGLYTSRVPCAGTGSRAVPQGVRAGHPAAVASAHRLSAPAYPAVGRRSVRYRRPGGRPTPTRRAVDRQHGRRPPRAEPRRLPAFREPSVFEPSVFAPAAFAPPAFRVDVPLAPRLVAPRSVLAGGSPSSGSA